MLGNTTIAFLDNDVLVLAALRQWMVGCPGCEVLWMEASPSKALHKCLYENPPQVMVVDMALGTTTGVDFCRTLRASSERMSILGMTANALDWYRNDLAAAGAQGLLSKATLPREILRHLPLLAHGYSIDSGVFPDAASAHADLVDRGKQHSIDAVLTSRESQVLRLYEKSGSTRQIAEEMGVKESTVGVLMHRVMCKLGVHKRDDALRKARRYELL